MTDRWRAARAVADAVLYEGYLLYPYRRSATKNQYRWQFGVLMPASVVDADPTERSLLRTEVVVDPGRSPALHVLVRFLRVRQRSDGWDEASAHEVVLEPLPLRDATARDDRFAVEGLAGMVRTEVAEMGHLRKVAVTVENRTDAPPRDRAENLRHALVSVHTLLAVDDGRLLSVVDPPADAEDAVVACRSDGTHPVLVGDVVLSSPIILHDQPAVAPESRGDLFDATEIDEILALRVLTMSDDEKAEARATDPRAAAIVDRVDGFTPDVWRSLHGTMREIRVIDGDGDRDGDEYDPSTETVASGDHEVRAGTAVVLHPNRRADAHDMFFTGMRATVAGVFTDLDGAVLVQVTIDDDPASDILSLERRGYFFHPDEIEVVG